jgi:hypothetical protein
LEGSGRVVILRHYPGIRLEGQRNPSNPSVRITGVRPRFEPGNSRIGYRSVNHSTTTFGRVLMRIFGPERREVTEDWKNKSLHSGEVS